MHRSKAGRQVVVRVAELASGLASETLRTVDTQGPRIPPREGCEGLASALTSSLPVPKTEMGNALAFNAGLGNLGVCLVQLVVPLVITPGEFGWLGGEPQTIAAIRIRGTGCRTPVLFFVPFTAASAFEYRQYAARADALPLPVRSNRVLSVLLLLAERGFAQITKVRDALGIPDRLSMLSTNI